MKLIEEITKKLNASSIQTWAELSEMLGKPRSYGQDIKRLMVARLKKINDILSLFGIELTIKSKKNYK